MTMSCQLATDRDVPWPFQVLCAALVTVTVVQTVLHPAPAYHAAPIGILGQVTVIAYFQSCPHACMCVQYWLPMSAAALKSSAVLPSSLP